MLSLTNLDDVTRPLMRSEVESDIAVGGLGLRLTSRDRIRVVSDHICEGSPGLQEGPATITSPRRAKRFLTAKQKYDLWQRMLTGQLTAAAAAAEAGVDRSTVMTLRKTARDGAIAALLGTSTSSALMRTPTGSISPPSASGSGAIDASARRAHERSNGLSLVSVAQR